MVGISLGDPSGIGPEIVEAALGSRLPFVPVLFGDASLGRRPRFARFARLRTLQGRPTVPTLVCVSALRATERRPGRPSRAGGRAQFDYVQAAIAAAKEGLVDALCTAPVSKEQISRAGVPFMGHTEVLAAAFDRQVLMLMAGPEVKIALATNHVPLREVPGLLHADALAAQLRLLSDGLVPLLPPGRRPRLALCSLNPHAGEGGLLGDEEARVLAPAIEKARAKGVRCEGPLAADGLFARAGRLPFDGVLALYHDQGLVAAKALDFERTVNVTLGLPLPRTSPDHGVAYGLAGTGRASAGPMRAALALAVKLARPGKVRTKKPLKTDRPPRRRSRA